MDELSNYAGMDISGWLYSGYDDRVETALFSTLINKTKEQNFIQVVILPESMKVTMSPVIENDMKNRGYLPSRTCRYFPAFSGKNVDVKERFVEILKYSQTDSDVVDKTMSYVEFIDELEAEFGNGSGELTGDVLWKYIRASTVEQTLNEAVASGFLSADDYEEWMSEYAECASGRLQLKKVLNRLDRCFSAKKDGRKSISSLGRGERICFVIASDMSEEMKNLLFLMIGWDILQTERRGKQVSLFVMEDRAKYGDELLCLLDVTASNINFNFFTQDFFSGHSEEWKDKIGGYFHRFVYSRHRYMQSCEEISEKRFGQIPVVRNSYGCDRDRRIANNRFLDILLDFNRVDHYVQHVPIWEPKYRKEDIYDMPEGTCLVQSEDYEGYVSLK